MKAFLDLECGFLSDRRLGKNDLKVLIVLIAHWNTTTKECFPGHKRLSEMTGIHYTHISTSVRRLCEFGYVKKMDRPGRSNLYRVLEPLAVFDKGQQKPIAESAKTPIAKSDKGPLAESANHNYKENYKNNYKRESSKKEQLRSFKVFEDRFGKSFQS